MRRRVVESTQPHRRRCRTASRRLPRSRVALSVRAAMLCCPTVLERSPCECGTQTSARFLLSPSIATGDRERDPPPLKWSTLSYVFAGKEDRNAEEALQAGRDRR